MTGLYHSPINPNQPYTNGTGGHLGGFYNDTTIPKPVGGFYGTVNNVDAVNSVPPETIHNANRILKGGRGYGMSLDQNTGFGFNKYPSYLSYDSIGMKNELNLEASTQHSPSLPINTSGGEPLPYSKYMTGGKGRGGRNGGRNGGKRGGKSHKYRGKGGANLTYYGFDKNLDGGDATTFKGSYAPISVHNSQEQEGQLGGRSKKYRFKIRSRRARAHAHSGRSRRRTHRHNKYCKHVISSRRSKGRSRSRSRSKAGKLGKSLKMTKELLQKIVNGNIGEGKYQKGGMQEISRGYTFDANVTPQTSALANPMNFKSYNTCLEQPRA
jgi:hypothetical protein